jgi:hypothetical protein
MPPTASILSRRRFLAGAGAGALDTCVGSQPQPVTARWFEVA